jgi:YjjG family noncanonical pyrimidine nucleotidase
MKKFAKYRLFLFDADHTLFDFEASEEAAFLATVGALGVDAVRATQLLPLYRRISKELWAALEKGRIAQAEIRAERFRRLFEAESLDLDADRAGHDYLARLSQGTHLMDGALEVCQKLRASDRPIGIVTNGYRRVQEPRLRASSLAPLVDWLVISEQVGFTKPDPRIFHHALGLSGHADTSTVLFVGDRLESDILGAQNAGLASCWFNPLGAANVTGIEPRYEISRLAELADESALLSGRSAR